MGSEKRQRQRENRMRAIAEAERAKKRSTTTRKVVRVVLIVAAVLLAILVWSWLSGDGEDSDVAIVTTDAADVDAGSDAVDEAEASETVEPSDQASASDAENTPDGAEGAPAGCPALDGSDGPRSQFDAPPPVCIDEDTTYTAEFETNLGSFTLALDPTLDPASVNNFIFLARWGAYDGTLFHRVISDFMIQGGDVQLQFGTGGPGYQFTGGFAPENWYRAGTLAMANRGNPASNGAQFFIITGTDGINLPPIYSPMGQLIEGLDTVCSIEGVDTAPGDAPVEEVIVNSVTIAEATEAQISVYAAALEGDRMADGC